jgi:acetyltransferase-like isoleucine patch superfamily enzyme
MGERGEQRARQRAQGDARGGAQSGADGDGERRQVGGTSESAGTSRWELTVQEVISLLPSTRLVVKLRAAYYRRVLARCGRALKTRQHVILRHTRNISVGNDVFLNRGATITAHTPIEIGDDCLIGPGAVLHNGDHRFDLVDLPIRRQGFSSAPIVLEDDVWIGANAVVLSGVRVGRGSVVAGGSVVTRDVPPYTVVGGVPAKPIARRGADRR